MHLLDHIASILKSFDIEQKPMDRLVHAYLKRHREISSKDRRAIGDAVFEAMRRRPMPDFLRETFVRSYGHEGASDLIARLNQPQSVCLRVNTLKAVREEVKRALEALGIESEETKFSPFGLKLSARANLGALDLYKRGLIEVQDEASQLAVIAANPKPGERVLDACAGAGGKSLMMAQLMENRGEILAADIEDKKLTELKKRATRAGASIIKTMSSAALMKKDDMRGKFDLVFVDAPCSGTGTIRRNPDLKWRLSPEIIEERIALQRRLISDYSTFVRPGGRLVYATCSILPCENEDVVEEFLKKGDFKITDVLKTDPRTGDLDGFFTACITRLPLQ